MPNTLLYHSFALPMSATSYFAVRNPRNIACSFVALCTYPAVVDVAADTSTRPARYANKHRNATSIVIVETCFSFTPRTGATSPRAMSTDATGATVDSVGAEADFLRRRVAGSADLTRGMLLLPDSIPAAAAAISTSGSRRGPDASPNHTSAANSPPAP